MNRLITPTPVQHIPIALHHAWVEFDESGHNAYLWIEIAKLLQQ